MMAVHEFGHCVVLWVTGGAVERVVTYFVHPITNSTAEGFNSRI